MNTLKKISFICIGMVLVSLLFGATINGWLDVPELTVSTNPASGWWRLYFKTDGKLYKRNSAGTEAEIASGTVPAAKIYIAAAGCDGTNGASVLDLPASSAPAATCYGTSYKFGALDFADSANQTATARLRLPPDWSGTLDAKLDWITTGTSVSAKWTLATACFADDEDALNPTFNTAQTITQTSSATASRRNTASQTSVTVTGCAAGESLLVKVGRDTTDTSTATHALLGVELTVGRQ